MSKILTVIIFTVLAGCSSGVSPDSKIDILELRYVNVKEGASREEYGLVVASRDLLIYEVTDFRSVTGEVLSFKKDLAVKDPISRSVALAPGKYVIGAHYDSKSAPIINLVFEVKAGGLYRIEYGIEWNFFHMFVVDTRTGEVVAGRR